MPVGRRIAIAALTGLPYLAASFLAQSAFKETAMALLVVAFAICLAARSGEAAAPGGRPVGWRPVSGVLVLLALAAVFTFSVPGLAWFALGLPLWLAFEGLAGRSVVEWGELRGWLRDHRLPLGVALLLVVIAAALAFSPAREFASKIADVQESAGRLSSPVFPGEALGIWPAGDFRVVRGEVTGSLFAVAVGALAIAYGAWVCLRRRELALLAMLVAGAAVYVGARLVAEIHVEAKALAIVAPLVILVSLRALMAPGNPIRVALGAVVLARRRRSRPCSRSATPRSASTSGSSGSSSSRPRPRARRSPSSASTASPATTCAAPWPARPPATCRRRSPPARTKNWQQGLAADFDSLEPGQLDRFRYAITTAAAYGSTAPPNFEPVTSAGDYVLWRRQGETPRAEAAPARGQQRFRRRGLRPRRRLRVPGRQAEARRRGGGRLTSRSTSRSPSGASRRHPRRGSPGRSAAGRRRARRAPSSSCPPAPPASPGELSLQYHSQVPLAVLVDGERVA